MKTKTPRFLKEKPEHLSKHEWSKLLQSMLIKPDHHFTWERMDYGWIRVRI